MNEYKLMWRMLRHELQRTDDYNSDWIESENRMWNSVEEKLWKDSRKQVLKLMDNLEFAFD